MQPTGQPSATKTAPAVTRPIASRKHRKACAKHGRKRRTFAAWQNGREQGLVEYCQPGRGYNVGVSGGRYYGVCSVDLEPDFLDAYNAGYHLYTLRSNVSRASSNISAKERELEKVEEEIRAKEAALIAKETTMEQRVLLLADLKELSERTGHLEAEIQVLYEERARYQVELDNYQAQRRRFRLLRPLERIRVGVLTPILFFPAFSASKEPVPPPKPRRREGAAAVFAGAPILVVHKSAAAFHRATLR